MPVFLSVVQVLKRVLLRCVHRKEVTSRPAALKTWVNGVICPQACTPDGTAASVSKQDWRTGATWTKMRAH